MTLHKMKLNESPFNKIKNGVKSIELRLNDEKRQLLKLKDEIEFTLVDSDETIKTKIIGLLNYDNFENLISEVDLSKFGAENKDKLLTDLLKYYPLEEQEKYSVLGIKIKLI